MKNKILVSVFVPTIEASFEFYIPINKKIGTIKKTIIMFVQKEYESVVTENDFINSLLIEKDTGTILPENNLVKDSIIENGTRLLLM